MSPPFTATISQSGSDATTRPPGSPRATRCPRAERISHSSRSATFSTLTLDRTYIGRSFQVSGEQTLYRIIGINSAGTIAYLSANYTGTTNATAAYKIFKYEFHLPPDCDTISQVYLDEDFGGTYTDKCDLDNLTSAQFNRLLASNVGYKARPIAFCRDGKISANNLPPLDE